LQLDRALGILEPVFPDMAERLHDVDEFHIVAVDAALLSHPTRDAGGSATTSDFSDAVLVSLERTLSMKETAWTSS